MSSFHNYKHGTMKTWCFRVSATGHLLKDDTNKPLRVNAYTGKSAKHLCKRFSTVNVTVEEWK